MIRLYTENDFEKMRAAAEILCQTHLAIKKVIKAGISTKALDDFANKFIVDHKKSNTCTIGLWRFSIHFMYISKR